MLTIRWHPHHLFA